MQVLKECFPGGFFGEDREGHPVWYDNFGNLDAKGAESLDVPFQVVESRLLCAHFRFVSFGEKR